MTGKGVAGSNPAVVTMKRFFRFWFVRRLMVYPERRVEPGDWAQMMRFEWAAAIWHLPGWRWF